MWVHLWLEYPSLNAIVHLWNPHTRYNTHIFFIKSQNQMVIISYTFTNQFCANFTLPGRQNLKWEIQSRGLCAWFCCQKKEKTYPFHPSWRKNYYLGHFKNFQKNSSQTHNYRQRVCWRNVYKVLNEDDIHSKLLQTRDNFYQDIIQRRCGLINGWNTLL